MVEHVTPGMLTDESNVTLIVLFAVTAFVNTSKLVGPDDTATNPTGAVPQWPEELAQCVLVR